MKNVLLFPLFCLLSFQLFAQTIPKKSSIIIIKNDKTALENYQLIGQTLLANDFQIEDSNKDFFTIKTQPQFHKKKLRGVQYFYNFVGLDKQIKLTGKFNISSLDNDWSEALFKGMKGSPFKYTFEQMDELAKLFDGEVLYKQPFTIINDHLLPLITNWSKWSKKVKKGLFICTIH